MTWAELKELIEQELDNRNLTNPDIRQEALKKIEDIIETHFINIYNNPILLLDIEKTDFQEQISKFTTLSGAKKSIINNLYNFLEEHSS